jgi:hypothetical protein
MFIALHVGSARQVAGFGAARSLDAPQLAQALAGASDADRTSADH